MKPLKGLYLVTDRSMIRTGSLDEVVRAAVRAGVAAVQLREKDATTRFFIEEAIRIRKLMEPYGIPLLINDRVDVAMAAGAHGVHLGQNDMPVTMARKLMGTEAIIGVSVETMAQVDTAEILPVDYIGVSGIFPTPTKTDLTDYWGIDGLKAVCARSRHPLVAIGGIHAGNAAAIIAAGADMIAVVSAICASEDPESSARAIINIIS